VQPTLIFIAKGETLGLIAKIQDWSVYIDRITKLIDRPRGQRAAVAVTIVPQHRAQGVEL
jgi:hydrogenase-1 operon protein HyaE